MNSENLETLRELARDDAAFERLQQIFMANQTAYQQAQEQISFLEALIDRDSNAVIATDISGKIIYGNRNAETLFQWHTEEVIGKNIIQVIGTQNSRQLLSELLANVVNCDRQQGEFILQCQDQSEFLAEVKSLVIKDSKNNISSVTFYVNDRKSLRLAKVIAANENKWQALIQNSSSIISIIQTDFTIRCVSPCVEKILGYKPEELVGKSVLEQIHPEDIQVVLSSLNDVIKNPSTTELIELRYRCKDGSWCFLESTISNLLANPSVAGIVSNSCDITERKRMEEALRQSEAQYRGIVEDQTELICRFLPDKSLTFVNDAYCRYFGLSSEELIGTNFMSLIPIQDHENYEKHLACLSQENPVASVEHRVIMPVNGEICWQQWSDRAIFDEQGNLVQFQSVGRDITTAKQGEQALRESEERLRLVIENMPVMMDALDDKGNIIAWNRECERVTGYSAAEIVGNPQAVQMLYPDRAYRQRMMVEWNKHGDEHRNWEWQLTCKDGSVKTIAWSNISKQFPISGWATWGIGVDVTERKLAEEELRQQSLRGQLMEAMRDRIRQSLNLGEILNNTVNEVRQFLRCDRVIVYRFQPDWSGVVVVESVSPDYTPMLTYTIKDTSLADSYIEQYRQGRIFAVDDIYTGDVDESYVNVLAQFQVRAHLVIPIIQDDGTLWGLLIAHHCSEPRHWQQFEIDLVSSLTSKVAIAIHQAQLYRQTEKQAARERSINRFTQVIRGTLDLETIFATAAQEVRQLLQVDGVTIQQYLREEQVWLTVADHCQISDLPNTLGWQMADADNEIKRQLKRLEVVRIDDTNTVESAASQQLASILPGAWLLVPLHFQNQLWGSLTLLIARRSHHWCDAEVELVSAIATQLSVAIQHSLMYKQLSELNIDLERQVQERTKELQQKIQELQQLNILKDDFLSTVSHELRTPLANMKMSIQMLKVAPNEERRLRYLDILQNECNREADLINDLLDLQRLEAASYPLLLNEAVDLYEWIPKMVESFRSRLQERQQTFTVEISPNLPSVVSDSAGLSRLLAELLNNACKYTASGGEIVLRVNKIENFFHFAISNQAEIPPAELSRIFEKFYRVPNADPWKQGGTGLGLALVQKLVDQLKGSIQVESSDGWTTFSVQLPVIGMGNC